MQPSRETRHVGNGPSGVLLIKLAIIMIGLPLVTLLAILAW